MISYCLWLHEIDEMEHTNDQDGKRVEQESLKSKTNPIPHAGNIIGAGRLIEPNWRRSSSKRRHLKVPV